MPPQYRRPVIPTKRALNQALETMNVIQDALLDTQGPGPWTKKHITDFERIAAFLGIPRSTFYDHLRKLRTAGVFDIETAAVFPLMDFAHEIDQLDKDTHD